jgi:hypothetical protein
MASLIQRGEIHYIQYRAGGKLKRFSTGTDSLQLAKEKLRQYESARMRGIDNPLPTRTPVGQIVGAYVDHIRATKTAKSRPDRRLLPARCLRPHLPRSANHQPQGRPGLQEAPAQAWPG